MAQQGQRQPGPNVSSSPKPRLAIGVGFNVPSQSGPRMPSWVRPQESATPGHRLVPEFVPQAQAQTYRQIQTQSTTQTQNQSQSQTQNQTGTQSPTQKGRRKGKQTGGHAHSPSWAEQGEAKQVQTMLVGCAHGGSALIGSRPDSLCVLCILVGMTDFIALKTSCLACHTCLRPLHDHLLNSIHLSEQVKCLTTQVSVTKTTTEIPGQLQCLDAPVSCCLGKST